MCRGFVGASLMFASNGALLASLLPWYPALVDEWGLDDVQFGFIVAAMPLGSLASSTLPARIISRRGPSYAVVAGTLTMAVLMMLIGHVSGGLELAILLLGFGVCDAIADVGQNVAGTRVQERSGASIISRLHAFWSLGAATGGALATWSAVAGTRMGSHLAVSAASCLAVASVGAWLVGDRAAALRRDVTDDARADIEEAFPKRAVPRTAWVAVLPSAAVATAGTAVEDLGQNWGGLAAHELTGMAVAPAGIAYAVFLSSQTVGRFVGDALVDAFGRARVAAAGSSLIAIGGVLVVDAASPAGLLAGFALAGLGCATLVPSAFAAAATIPGLSDGAGITLVGWLMRTGFLATSPVVGAIATGTGLNVALGSLIMFGFIATACSPALRARDGSGA